MTLKWISAAVILLSFTGHGFGQGTSPPSLQALDPLVQRQEYNAALARLKEARASDEEKRAWLRRHAEEGHVPLQYELAVMSFPTSHEDGFRWYARGRLARTLDAAECATDSASLGARVQLDQKAAAIRDAGVADPKAFQRAIEDALAWHQKRANPPTANWICGPGNPQGGANGLKPEPERSLARADALTNMQVAAKMITDFERAVAAGKAASYRALDSRVVPTPSVVQWIGWLDNERVMFIGRAGPNADGKPDGARGLVHSVILWDVKTGELRTLASGTRIDSFCVDGSHVVFKVVERADAESAVWLYQGNWPALTKRAVGLNERVTSPFRFDCQPPSAAPKELRADQVWRLYRDDGIVAIPSTGSAGIFVRKDGRQIELPGSKYNTRPLAYAPWIKAYLLVGEARQPGAGTYRRSGDRRRGDETVLFWLHPDGRTEPFVVPYGVWDPRTDNTSLFYRPTRKGLTLAREDFETQDLPGFAGLYLIDASGQVVLLIAGQVSTGAVSPDGCRVAFAHALTQADAKALQTTVKAIDLCEGAR